MIPLRFTAGCGVSRRCDGHEQSLVIDGGRAIASTSLRAWAPYGSVDRFWHLPRLPPEHMIGGATRESRRQTPAQQLRALAEPHRFRVQADAEGFPVIPGRYGQIEWYCDGVNCSSCALPGQLALAVYTDRPRLFSKIWAVPGVRRHQTGDSEMRAVFPPEALEQVAGVIRARRKRILVAEEARRRGFKPTPRATSGR